MKKSDLKNGMYVKFRNNKLVEYYKGHLIVEYPIYSGHIFDYQEDLINRYSGELDIIEVFDRENGDMIWKRKEINWNNIPFGTKVMCWNHIRNKHEGRFLGYDESVDEYVVFVSVDKLTSWKCCELIEDVKEITQEEVD